MRIAEGKAISVKIDAGDVPDILGPTRFEKRRGSAYVGTRSCNGPGLDTSRRRHSLRRVGEVAR